MTAQRDRVLSRGNGAPEFRFPPTCSPLKTRAGDQERRDGRLSMGTHEAEGGAFDRRRGSILTRVAASSIESSAPRSMWSRCASRV